MHVFPACKESLRLTVGGVKYRLKAPCDTRVVLSREQGFSRIGRCDAVIDLELLRAEAILCKRFMRELNMTFVSLDPE